MTARKPQTTIRTLFGGAAARAVALAAALALALAACGTDVDTDEVQMARATWDSGHMQAAVYAQLIQELGYEVTDPADHTLDPNGFYPALASGQYDLWANGWFPIHDIYLKGELVTGQSTDLPIEPVGWQVASGALQGYMIDKKTADEMNITSMDDVARNADTFDQDGDGSADLIGCNKGWGCNTVIDSHIASFGWGSSVEQVVGDYGDLMQKALDRVAAGDPVLFYAWTPNWTLSALVPGEDVMWITSEALPDDVGSTMVSSLRGCEWDPCDLGWTASSIRAVANIDFLEENPQIRRLLELVTIPLGDIAAQNARMVGGGYTEEQIQDDAATWISDNRGMVESWLESAQSAE